jgi:hypothetical protein
MKDAAPVKAAAGLSVTTSNGAGIHASDGCSACVRVCRFAKLTISPCSGGCLEMGPCLSRGMTRYMLVKHHITVPRTESASSVRWAQKMQAWPEPKAPSFERSREQNTGLGVRGATSGAHRSHQGPPVAAAKFEQQTLASCRISHGATRKSMGLRGCRHHCLS